MSAKDAITPVQINELIAKRWSPRAFIKEPIDSEIVLKITEAARWSSSSFNEQPWRIIVGLNGDDTWNKILDSALEFNQEWAKNAPMLVLIVSKTNFTHKNIPNSHHFYDCGQAANSMLIQAVEDDIYCRQMAGFIPEKAIKNFNIPEAYKPAVLMAFGYRGNEKDLGKLGEDENKPRVRKSREEIIWSDWDKALEL
jgi:nitroreductase